MHWMAQYLEPGPYIAEITPQAAAQRLREALARLPLEGVILGWDLPEPLVEAVYNVAARAGCQLWLWHPLLTAQGAPPGWEDWRVIAANGRPAPAFNDLPEFTFLCPRQPEVRAFALERLARALADERYTGVMLDRIRYPSPLHDLRALLGCFCPHCLAAAQEAGIDLERLRRNTLEEPNRLVWDKGRAWPALLVHWWQWRMAAVTEAVAQAAELTHARGRQVGLDLWSHAYADWVGQDKQALGSLADWVKVMVYRHTWAPAGLPYELAAHVRAMQGGGDATARALVAAHIALDAQLSAPPGMAERAPLDSEGALLMLLGRNLGWGGPMPRSLVELREQGLPSHVLDAECYRARLGVRAPLWVGLDWVEILGVTHLTDAQVTADVASYHYAVGRAIISWDLWHVPLERLEVAASASDHR